MNVVDSSGWLEYFSNGPNAAFFADAVEATDELIVPTVSLHEVFQRVLQQRGENEALEAVALIMQGDVIALDVTLALSAAKLSADLRLPMADSIILATARSEGAVLWTQDAHFNGLEGVRYTPA